MRAAPRVSCPSRSWSYWQLSHCRSSIGSTGTMYSLSAKAAGMGFADSAEVMLYSLITAPVLSFSISRTTPERDGMGNAFTRYIPGSLLIYQEGKRCIQWVRKKGAGAYTGDPVRDRMNSRPRRFRGLFSARSAGISGSTAERVGDDIGGDRRREGWGSICALASRYRRPTPASGLRCALLHRIVAACRGAASQQGRSDGTCRPAQEPMGRPCATPPGRTGGNGLPAL